MDKLITFFSFSRQHAKLLIGIAILILASSTFVAYLNSRELIKHEKSTDESYETLQRMEKLLSTMLDAETGRRGYFITEDPEFLKSYTNASSTVDTLYSKIKIGTSENPVQQSNLDTLTTLIRERFSLFEQGIRLQDTRGTDRRIHKSNMDRGVEINTAIRRIVGNMIKEERRVLSENQEIELKSSKFTVYSLLSGAVFSIILLAFAFTLLVRLSAGNYDDKRTHSLSRDELETIIRDRTAEISQMNYKLNQRTSEIEKLQNTLRLYERSYKSLYDQSHDAILIFDPETEKILDVNTKACDIYGLSKKEFKGLSLKYLSKNIPQGQEEIRETIKKGYYHTFQAVHYKKDGNEMLMEISASVINYRGRTAILSLNHEITHKVFQPL